ncbi:MAG: phage Gp37/Gp68 family protein, partial [Actinobacteria bacterium]|nr:phage Gp37/Gp68 family protein [Actinomycetota bacterium]
DWAAVGNGAIDWLIAGGESGAGARPAHPAWFRAARDFCGEQGVAFFFKQVGEWSWENTAPDARRAVVGIDGRWIEGMPFGYGETFQRCAELWRVGKRAAGRLLDHAVRGGAVDLAPVLPGLASLRFRIWNPALARVARAVPAGLLARAGGARG